MVEEFTIILQRNFGFFTNFFHTLQHIDAAVRQNRIPIVYWNSPIYKEKKAGEGYNGVKNGNIWEYFFEPVSQYSINDIDINSKHVIKVQDFRQESASYEPLDCWKTGFPPSPCLNNMSKECRIYINNLIKKYVKIKSIVQEKINTFYLQNMDGYHMVGAHWRACSDQRMAQGDRPGKRFKKAILSYVGKREDYKVFLATDLERAVHTIHVRFGDKLIVRDSIRSNKDCLWSLEMRQIQSMIRRNKSVAGSQAAEDVLIECILLSRCNCLFHGWSNVSAAAGCFNPDLNCYFVPYYTPEYKKYLET